MKLPFVLCAAVLVGLAVADSPERNATEVDRRIIHRIDKVIDQVKELVEKTSVAALKIDPANYTILNSLYEEAQSKIERFARIYMFHADGIITSHTLRDRNPLECRHFFHKYLKKGTELSRAKTPANFLRDMISIPWSRLSYESDEVIAQINSTKDEALTTDLSPDEFYNKTVMAIYERFYKKAVNYLHILTDELIRYKYDKELNEIVDFWDKTGREVIKTTFGCVYYGQPLPYEPVPHLPVTHQTTPHEPVPEPPATPQTTPHEPVPELPATPQTLFYGPVPELPAAPQTLLYGPVPELPAAPQTLLYGPVPHPPMSTQPMPDEPIPAQLMPAQPNPDDTKPVEPMPAQPELTQAMLHEPMHDGPILAQPMPDEPMPAQPKPDEPMPAQPEPTQAMPDEPMPAQPMPAQPMADEPGQGRLPAWLLQHA